jgi:hypothetical protein
MTLSPRARVVASRTSLVMLLVAAAVLIGLGVAALVLVNPPETGGWLRAVFGKVFGVVALGLGLVLGVPAAVGLWAMAGARAEGAVAYLSPQVRLGVAISAIVTVVIVAVAAVASGTDVLILNLGLVALVALATLGLAGAAVSSPHKWRAILAAIALVLVEAGSLLVLVRALLVLPG